jgi:hypothetical protein
MIPELAFVAWIKSTIEKLAFGGIVLYALKRKQNVAARFAKGTFEIIATEESGPPRLGPSD